MIGGSCLGPTVRRLPHSPARHQLLNGGGRWQNPFLESAFSIGRLVNALDAIIAQHLQSAGELCQKRHTGLLTSAAARTRPAMHWQSTTESDAIRLSLSSVRSACYRNLLTHKALSFNKTTPRLAPEGVLSC